MYSETSFKLTFHCIILLLFASLLMLFNVISRSDTLQSGLIQGEKTKNEVCPLQDPLIFPNSTSFVYLVC